MAFPLIDDAGAAGLLSYIATQCQTWEQEELALVTAMPHMHSAMQMHADAPAIHRMLAANIPAHQADIYTDPIQRRIHDVCEEGRAHAPSTVQAQIMEAAVATVQSVQHAHALETARRQKPEKRAAGAGAAAAQPQQQPHVAGGRLFAAAAARHQTTAAAPPAIMDDMDTGGSNGGAAITGLDVYALLAQQDARLAVVPLTATQQSQATPRRPPSSVSQQRQTQMTQDGDDDDDEDQRRQDAILRMMQTEEDEMLLMHAVDRNRGGGMADDDDDDDPPPIVAAVGDGRRHSGSGAYITDYLSPSPRSLWRSDDDVDAE